MAMSAKCLSSPESCSRAYKHKDGASYYQNDQNHLSDELSYGNISCRENPWDAADVVTLVVTVSVGCITWHIEDGYLSSFWRSGPIESPCDRSIGQPVLSTRRGMLKVGYATGHRCLSVNRISNGYGARLLIVIVLNRKLETPSLLSRSARLTVKE